jgi:hypothetical protein
MHAKVQAALLEAMEERQVTVAGETHAMEPLSRKRPFALSLLPYTRIFRVDMEVGVNAHPHFLTLEASLRASRGRGLAARH